MYIYKQVHLLYSIYENTDLVKNEGDFVEFDIHIRLATIGDSSNTSGGGSNSGLVKESSEIICEHDYRVRYHSGATSHITRQMPCATGTTDYNPITSTFSRVDHTLGNGDGRQINTYRECRVCFRQICTPCHREL